MISFSNNKWEANEVADKLSKQLFIKPAIQKKRKNREIKNVNIESSKDISEKSRKHSGKSRNQPANPSKKFKKKGPTIGEESIKKLNSLHKQNEGRKIRKRRRKLKKNKKEGIDDNHEGDKKSKLDSTTKVKPEISTTEMKKVEEIKPPKERMNVQKIEKLLKLKGKSIVKKKDQPTSLRERMVAHLRASRFRFLNETLYKNNSTVSKQMFKEDPEAFTAYHSGYQQQVNHWPLNPLDIIISAVKKMPKDYIIADFGCGEGKLADSVPQRVHSFDLVAVNEKITACDMAHTPLLINGVNVVIFCLSLMGTNLNDYLREANRVLKKEGILKIAEIESRFDNINEFIKLLESYGFKNTWTDLSHNIFYFLDFKKISEINRKNNKLPEIALKPCLYKKR